MKPLAVCILFGIGAVLFAVDMEFRGVAPDELSGLRVAAWVLFAAAFVVALSDEWNRNREEDPWG